MKKKSSIILALITWVTLFIQLALVVIIKSLAGDSIWDATINYLSLFSVESNIAVAMVLTVPLIIKRGPLFDFFNATAIQAMVVMYSFMVFMIYDWVLHDLWVAEGIQFALNYMLHNAIPLAYIVWWFNFSDKGRLQYWYSFPWLIAPIVYMSITLTRGWFTGFYPYPFIDVDRIGMATVLYNTIGMLFLFWIAGLILIWIDKKRIGTNTK
jgi:hypothetical protein